MLRGVDAREAVQNHKHSSLWVCRSRAALLQGLQSSRPQKNAHGAHVHLFHHFDESAGHLLVYRYSAELLPHVVYLDDEQSVVQARAMQVDSLL